MSDCDRPGCYLGWHWVQREVDDVAPIEPCPVGTSLKSDTAATETRPKATPCDVTDCDNPSVWVDVGDAGDFFLCSKHMRP